MKTAEELLKELEEIVKKELSYPDIWDTMAYPTVWDALWEQYGWIKAGKELFEEKKEYKKFVSDW